MTNTKMNRTQGKSYGRWESECGQYVIVHASESGVAARNRRGPWVVLVNRKPSIWGANPAGCYEGLNRRSNVNVFCADLANANDEPRISRRPLSLVRSGYSR